MKRILIAVLCFALVGVTGAFAATAPVSPIVDASWATILVDENGVGDSVWYTDKGFLSTDSQPFIKDSRLMVSFRWATEVFGGSAVWESRKDGSTSSVTLFAPPVQTVTVTVTVPVTVTNTIYVTNTVTILVPALLPTMRLVRSNLLATVSPTATISFWGIAPIGNSTVSVVAAGDYPYPVGAQVVNVPADVHGYFAGTLTDTKVIGPWKITAIQQDWTSNVEYFTVSSP